MLRVRSPHRNNAEGGALPHEGACFGSAESNLAFTMRSSSCAGLTELESAGMRGIVMRAVRAAAKRSEDMG